MPTYLYNGLTKFVSKEYNIEVEPNQTVETKYILPYSWTDFTLLDINTPEPILPYTEEYSVSSLTEVTLEGYNTVVVLLTNPETSTLNLHLYDSNSSPIILDNFVNYWVGKAETLYTYFEKIYLNPVSGTPNVRIYKGIIGSEYGSLESIGGGSGNGCIMETTEPVPTTHGGLEAGTDISGMTPCQVLNLILFPYQYPAFSSFYIQGQSVTLEVGDSVVGGNRTFIWTTTNSQNIQPNSIKIEDVSSSVTLGTNLDNDGNEVLDIGSDKVRTSAGSYTWRISALNTKGNSFSRNFIVRWLYRKYWGYNSNSELTENDIKNLQNSSLSNSYSGTYNFTNPGTAVYYYVVYPSSWGNFNTWINTENNFGVDYTEVSSVDVTNDFGVTINYKVFRTTYLQNGDLNSQMS